MQVAGSSKFTGSRLPKEIEMIEIAARGDISSLLPSFLVRVMQTPP
jgi:hypothetical protein